MRHDEAQTTTTSEVRIRPEVSRQCVLRGTMLILLLGMSVLLAGCFPGKGHFDDERRAGFFSGIWHGWIVPISLVSSFFDEDVRIYESQNVGWWYDRGF